ncbi:histidine kinase [Streptomyces sp. NBC_00841]|uniref:sensor histidine kinase n=1 Tax=unclassified Streptomyces TaxID=2593676 RepID=UPI00225556BF|nr:MULTISPECIES: histidine kinase [unclassified Streptomyces]MCX4532150.1 histidine kinase [Streptomyces sp. NBC_01669]WSA02340.1 histidine kinase [Streptomyces sp. NBC_00841]
MTRATWTSWPSREALSRQGRTRPRAVIAWSVRALLLVLVLWGTFTAGKFGPWEVAVGLLGVLGCAWTAWAFFRTSLEHRLWPSLGLMALLMAAAFGAQQAGAGVPAVVLWCGCAVTALERLPLSAAVPATAVALAAYAAVNADGWMTTALTTGGLCLAGYVLRLDAEARGSALRLLAQERAARAAEAESAALNERSRIAREIHDVLAHSLSAQLVHLEAARLLIERQPSGEFRDQVLERVVAARSMAREGLAETRQALAALRGEVAPVEDFLRQLVTAEPGEVTVAGEQRPLTAEASQTVRRVAQEALTNVRKHAPGATVLVRLEYLPGEVALEVRDRGGHRPVEELAVSGSGYGLLGMRERAELLGGTLEAGPGEEGFVVSLRVPA